MNVCLGHLLMPPDAFWRLTMTELRAILGRGAGGGEESAMHRAELEALMSSFPDRRSPEGVRHGQSD